MRYSNAPQKEGVNAQEGRGEGREFVLLGVSFIVLALVVSLLFLRVGAVLGLLVPFSWEQKLVPARVLRNMADAGDPVQKRLQALANTLFAAMDMPEDMHVQIHYSDSNTQNAFATFGGNIVMFEGLLSRLDSEDAIAALLAHEMAHVKHRHVIKGATGGVLLSLLWASLGFSGDTGGQIGGIGSLNQLPILSGTRAMERQADAQAVSALVAVYGHAGGYFALFKVLEGMSKGDTRPNVLRSHPKVADRVAAAKKQLPQYQLTGPLIPWSKPSPIEQ